MAEFGGRIDDARDPHRSLAQLSDEFRVADQRAVNYERAGEFVGDVSGFGVVLGRDVGGQQRAILTGHGAILTRRPRVRVAAPRGLSDPTGFYDRRKQLVEE